MGFKDQELLDQLPHLRRFAISLMKDREKADDLVQDCLVRALTKKTSFETGTNLRSWLFTILHNLFIDSHRRGSSQSTTVAAHDAIDRAMVAPRQSDRLLLGELGSTIAKLPSAQRYVILLVSLHGYSYQEVAAMTGVPVGTVRSRLSRARGFLRGRLHLDEGLGTEAVHVPRPIFHQRGRPELFA